MNIAGIHNIILTELISQEHKLEYIVSHKTPTAVIKVAWCCTGLRTRRHRGQGVGNKKGVMPFPIRLGRLGSIMSSPGRALGENEFGQHFL